MHMLCHKKNFQKFMHCVQFYNLVFCMYNGLSWGIKYI